MTYRTARKPFLLRELADILEKEDANTGAVLLVYHL
jgi:hypothetical protein